MSTPFLTGPVGIFIAAQNGAASSAVFVGVGDKSPDVNATKHLRPVHTDYSGDQAQGDDVECGETHIVTVNLIQTVPAAIEILKGGSLSVQGGALVAPANPGTHPFGTRGTLMQAEGKCFSLFLFYPLIAVKPTGAGRPVGVRYPVAKVKALPVPPHDMTAPCIQRFTFECTELLSFSSGLPNWLLYDYNVAGLPVMG